MPAGTEEERHVGQRIRERRLALNLSLDAVERRADLPGGALSRIEAGQRRTGPADLLGIATVLGVSIDYFFDGLSDHPPSEAAPDIDPALDPEGRQFLRAYLSIGDRRVRRDIFKLVRAVANDQAPA